MSLCISFCYRKYLQLGTGSLFWRLEAKAILSVSILGEVPTMQHNLGRDTILPRLTHNAIVISNQNSSSPNRCFGFSEGQTSNQGKGSGSPYSLQTVRRESDKLIDQACLQQQVQGRKNVGVWCMIEVVPRIWENSRT